MNASQLVAHYHGLESKLLTRWDAPLINDFFAMIFFGVLRSLSAKWCQEAEESLQNDLLAGEGGMISAEPAQRVRQMAEMIRDDFGFSQLLLEGSLEEINEIIPQNVAFQEAYAAYLGKFGDRCLDELKLESATLHDDPPGARAPLPRGGEGGPGALDEGGPQRRIVEHHGRVVAAHLQGHDASRPIEVGLEDPPADGP